MELLDSFDHVDKLYIDFSRKCIYEEVKSMVEYISSCNNVAALHITVDTYHAELVDLLLEFAPQKHLVLKFVFIEE
jgi:hypothetical protein